MDDLSQMVLERIHIMIKSKEDLLATVSARLEGDTSDEAISLFEDLSDTLTDMETKANGDGTDWKAKYEENDAEWRKKYKERFFNSSANEDCNENCNDGEEPPTKRISLIRSSVIPAFSTARCAISTTLFVKSSVSLSNVARLSVFINICGTPSATVI